MEEFSSKQKKENVTKSNTETELNTPTEFESQVKN